MEKTKGVIVVLTLKKHEDGIWIRKLVESLQTCILRSSKSPTGHPSPDGNEHDVTVEVEVRALEDWLGPPGWVVSSSNTSTSSSSSSSSSNALFHNIAGIVNRVSDAAPPALFKTCLAVLQVASTVYQIPVWNGPSAYGLCANKWCHHVLFERAGLAAPTTAVTYGRDGKGNSRDDDDDDDGVAPGATTDDTGARNLVEVSIDTAVFDPGSTLLRKPNAGGFGAGVEEILVPLKSKVDATDENNSVIRVMVTSASSSSAVEDDNVTLVQMYHNGHQYCDDLGGADGETSNRCDDDDGTKEENINSRKLFYYRVWFLQGKVQCAVERCVVLVDERATTDMADGPNIADSTPKNVFTSGCAGNGGVCALPTKNPNMSKTSTPSTLAPSEPAATIASTTMIAWKVPPDVQKELEEQLFPLVPDMHCGSVEFLYDSDDDDNNNKPPNNQRRTQRRLHFDLNLLSTLPMIRTADDEGHGRGSSNGVVDTNKVWPDDYDPWMELAASIFKFIVVGQ